MKETPLACQARGKSGGNLPELGRCCCCRVLSAGMGQSGGQWSLCRYIHTKVLSHAGLGERRSFRETREVVRGEICSRWDVMWTEIQAGLPALKASSVSGDHTAAKMCDLQKTSAGAPWFPSGAAFNIKPFHLYFATATCVQSYALTLSSASSDVTHCAGLAWPSLGSVCPSRTHRSCSALLAWCWDCAQWHPCPAEGPAPCHSVHRPRLQLSWTNTEGDTMGSPAISMGRGTRLAEELVQGQKVLGTAGCVRRQTDVSVKLLRCQWC